MWTRKSETHVERLKKLFIIHGDDVAQLKIEEALKDDRFQDTIQKLRTLEISSPQGVKGQRTEQENNH